MRRKKAWRSRPVALATVALVLASLVGLWYWHDHRPAAQAKRLVAMLRCQPPGFVEKWMVKLKLAQPKPQLEHFEIEAQILALGPDALPAVASLLKEGDADLAITGMELLRRLADRRATGPLLEAMDRAHGDGGPNEINDFAAVCLGHLGDPQAIEPVLAYARKRPSRRLGAAMGGFHDARTIEAMLHAAHIPQENQYTLDLSENKAVLALVEVGKAGVDALLQLLDDEDPSIVHNAVIALRDAGDARAVGALLRLLYAERDYSGFLGRPDVQKNYVDSKHHGRSPISAREVRHVAIGALGLFDDPQALEFCELLLRPPTRWMEGPEAEELDSCRCKAIECLAARGDPHGAILRWAVAWGPPDDQNRFSRFSTLDAICLMGDRRDAPFFQSLVDSLDAEGEGDWLSMSAPVVLGAIGDERSIDCLACLLKKKPDQVAITLAMIGKPQAIELLESMAQDDKVSLDGRAWAATALVCLNSEKWMPLVKSRPPVKRNDFTVNWLPWLRFAGGGGTAITDEWPAPGTMTLADALRDVRSSGPGMEEYRRAARWLVEHGRVEEVAALLTPDLQVGMWVEGERLTLDLRETLYIAMADFGDARFLPTLWQAYRRACTEEHVPDSLRSAIITLRLRLRQTSSAPTSR